MMHTHLLKKSTFTDAIENAPWMLLINSCDYMKVLYIALLNLFNETENDIKQGRSYARLCEEQYEFPMNKRGRLCICVECYMKQYNISRRKQLKRYKDERCCMEGTMKIA
uniref:Uncharacterized protein n=1 Tax=Salix viminalis TaxID=40686 RepID=A0A6N2KR12_SALVM